MTITDHQQHQEIDAPVSLGGFFGPDDSDDEDDKNDDNHDGNTTDNNNNLLVDNCYEIQSFLVAGETINIRQYAFHSHNANRVWPGAFYLADYLLQTKERGGNDVSVEINGKNYNDEYLHNWGNVLELGTATGLLAIRLSKAAGIKEEAENIFCCSSIFTSDVDDDYNEVGENVKYNFELNGIPQPPHVPHTWGTGWKSSAAKLGLADRKFDTIVASDILLYVSAYGALVETLKELMVDEGEAPTKATTTSDQGDANPDAIHTGSSGIASNKKFIMSWKRRMDTSDFFNRMKEAGFHCETIQGKYIYIFEYRGK